MKLEVRNHEDRNLNERPGLPYVKSSWEYIVMA